MALLRIISGSALQKHPLRYNSIFFSILPRFNLPLQQSFLATITARHDHQQRQQSGGPRLSSTSTPTPPDYHHHHHPHQHPSAPADSPHAPPLCSNAKRIHIVDYSSSSDGATAVYALRLRSPRDFRRMLATSGLLCLVPAQQDIATKAWRIAGDGTRCFSDLRENTFYMAMSALRPNSSSSQSHKSASSSEQQTLASLRATVNQVRKELTNRALGEEGELTEALLRIFCKEAGFPGMVSKPQMRIVENEEVDAVLLSARAMAIGFHCNKLTHKEALAALKRVSRWLHLASTGSSAHSFLLGKDVYVVLSGNLLPAKEYQRVVSYCQKHRLLLLLKNGLNFSLHNSLLPPQHIVPAKLRPRSTPITTTTNANEKKPNN